MFFYAEYYYYHDKSCNELTEVKKPKKCDGLICTDLYEPVCSFPAYPNAVYTQPFTFESYCQLKAYNCNNPTQSNYFSGNTYL